MDNYRILFISDHAGQLGGGEKSMLELVSSLVKKGHSVYAVLPGYGDFYDSLSDVGVICRKLKMPVIERKYNPFYLIYSFLYLLYFGIIISFWVRKHKIQIIHANKTTSLFFALSVSIFAWRPFVWHVRSYNCNFGLIGKLAYRFTDQIICISRDLAEPFIQYFGKKKINIVHNGVRVEPLPKVIYKSGELACRMVVNQPDFIVGVAGRITECKRFETFIEAFAILNDTIKQKRIYGVIMGDCITSNPVQMEKDLRYKHRIRDMVRKMKLTDTIRFIGFEPVPQEFIREMDVLVLPSVAEPFGRVIIEAMALGVAVIAARAGGIPEIVIHEKTGLLFAPGNARELACAMKKLFDDPPLRRRLGKAGWERADKHFSTRVYVSRIEKIYKKILTD